MILNTSRKRLAHKTLAVALLLAGLSATGQAQVSTQSSACSSDGVAVPRQLIERFLSADCADCWSQAASPLPQAGQLPLDWILPSPQGDDAPLSAAATTDAQLRLQQLKPDWRANARSLPVNIALQRLPRTAQPQLRLRVAHGLPFKGYLGTSIELKGVTPANIQRFQALLGDELRIHLALIEHIPAGQEGNLMARNIVRNVFQRRWSLHSELSKTSAAARKADPMLGKAFYESRPMSLHENVQTKRLAVVGWLEDAQGRLVTAAQSACR